MASYTLSRGIIYPAEIDRILRMPGGPVGVKIRRISLDIAAEAQAIARRELGNRHPSDAKRTGNYARKFRVTVERTAGGYEFVISNPTKYASVLEGGSVPHKIEARRAKYLRFRSRKTGQMVTVKVVSHPGQKQGYFILSRATQTVVRKSLHH